MNEVTVVYQERGQSMHWYPRNDTVNDRTVKRLYTEVFQFLCRFKRLREIDFWAPFDSENMLLTGSLGGLKAYAKAKPGIFDAQFKPKAAYWSVAEVVARSAAKRKI